MYSDDEGCELMPDDAEYIINKDIWSNSGKFFNY
jgi:hypothetical protein